MDGNGRPAQQQSLRRLALANQGQLKLFTQKTVFYLDSNLPGGAGPTLDGMVAGWSSFYATNGYSSTNPAPADFDVVNQGQLKYIGSLIYGQLEGAGYTGLTPSWLQPNTNTEYIAANLGQLKTVFNFDLSMAPPAITGLTATSTNPGEVDLSWALPAGNNATSILIEQSTDGGITWTSLGAVSPTDTSDVISYGSPPPGPVTYRATPSNSNGSAPPTTTTTPTSVLPQPRYAVIDLGTNVVPAKITDSGYVLLGTNAVWGQGISQALQLSGGFTSLTANDITEDGVTVGTQLETIPKPPANNFWIYGFELIQAATLWSTNGTVLTGPTILSGNDQWAGYGTVPDPTDPSQFRLYYALADYDMGMAIDPSHHVWTYRNRPIPGTTTPDPNTTTSQPPPQYYISDSYNPSGVEMGTPDTFGPPEITMGSLIYIIKVNNQSQVLTQGNAYDSSGSVTNTFYQIGTSVLGFQTYGLSNQSTNGTTYVIGQDTNGAPAHWWNGTDHTMTNFYAAAINAATVTTNNGASYQPAAQMVGSGYINGSWAPALMEMNPTNGVFGIPQKLDQLISTNSSWSSIAVSGSSINDNGAIVGTATYSGTNTAIASGSHGVLLAPAYQIQVSTFIPQQWLSDPPGYVYVGNDPRKTPIDGSFTSGTATFFQSSDPAKIKMQQSVMATVLANVDPGGTQESYTLNTIIGPTKKFYSAAVPGGTSTKTNTLSPTATPFATQTATPILNNVTITHPSNNVVVVELECEAKDPLANPGAPEIETPNPAPPIYYDITVKIDATTTPPTYTLSGNHKNFPACAVYINQQLVHDYSPIPGGYTPYVLGVEDYGPALSDPTITGGCAAHSSLTGTITNTP